jgi:hypothetical protein
MRESIDGKALDLPEQLVWAAGFGAALGRLLPTNCAIRFADNAVREVRTWFAENPVDVTKEGM